MTTIGILLAAGRSERFGPENKLLAPFQNTPLVSHAANALRAVPTDGLIIVTRSNEVAALLPDFDMVAPTEAATDQSASLHAGISAAAEQGAHRALVVLGDMPLIQATHLQDVLALCTEDQAAASTDGNRRLPPACFPKALFSTLIAQNGDKGARTILSALDSRQLVRADRAHLTDVDTQSDLETLHAKRDKN